MTLVVVVVCVVVGGVTFINGLSREPMFEFEFEFNTSSCENKCLKAQMHMYII